MATEVEVCQYSARHAMDGVEATRVIDCGPVGLVQCCEKCAEFYARMVEASKR